MTADVEIRFRDVDKTYLSDFKRKKTIALSELTFDVKKSEVFGIVGPNGAGKSTTLKILLGFVKQSAGTVSLSGRSPNDPIAHRLVGYLPENPCLYENLSPTEHLKFSGRVAGLSPKETSKKIERVMDLVKLSDVSDTQLRKFSKGMTQRAALAYALFHDPEILILDEPMSGLDPLGRQLVVDIISEYHRAGNTILFCSHILSDVERICDRIGIMNKGKLATVVTPDKLGNIPLSPNRRSSTPLEALFIETVQSGDPVESPDANES